MIKSSNFTFSALDEKVHLEYFDEFKLGPINLRNRFVVPPMCTELSKDGNVNIDHLVHYASLAKGGSGLVVVEATAITPDGRISDRDLVLNNTGQVRYFNKLSSVIKKEGAIAALQISHAGRKALLSEGVVVSASKLAFSEDEPYQKPHILTTQEVDEIVDMYVNTAMLAHEAGFDAIELHAAHGYLIHQFISPITNQRLDKYKAGGAFISAILQGINDSGIDIPVIVRFSATEYVRHGIQLEDIINIINDNSDYIDVVHVSSGGGVEDVKIIPFAGYQLDMASLIKISTNKPTIAVGLLDKPEMINYALYTGKADAIAIGRANLINPFYVNSLKK